MLVRLGGVPPLLRARWRYAESRGNVGFADGSGERVAGAPAYRRSRRGRRDRRTRTVVFCRARRAAWNRPRFGKIRGGNLPARQSAPPPPPTPPPPSPSPTPA